MEVRVEGKEVIVRIRRDQRMNMEVRVERDKVILSFDREGEEDSEVLPEHLVEKIVSMVSFPSLFKFQCLSKAWLTRFSARPSLAISFQKQVSEHSNSWETFYPICIGKENSFAYSRVSQVWRRLPGLSFLPNRLPSLMHRSRLYLEGEPILDRCGLQVEGEGSVLYFCESNYKLNIVNILTQSSKCLRRCPNRGGSVIVYQKLFSDTSSGTPKLIVFVEKDVSDFVNGSDYCLAHIYDCKSESWSVKRFVDSRQDALAIFHFLHSDGFNSNANEHAVLDGVLYILPFYFEDIVDELLAIDAEGGTFKVLRLKNGIYGEECDMSINLVVCNADLLMIVIYHGDPNSERQYSVIDPISNERQSCRNDEVNIFKIELESPKDSLFEWLSVVALTGGPPADLNVGGIYGPPVSDGESITFLEKKGNGGRLVEYNVVTDEWSLLTGPPLISSPWDNLWLGSSFNPGFNAFGDV